MIDSFGISEGMCARGNGCACTHLQACIPLLMSSVLLLTPMCCVHGWPETATRERRGSVGAGEKGKKMLERKTSRSVTCSSLQPMHTEGLRDCHNRESRGLEK